MHRRSFLATGLAAAAGSALAFEFPKKKAATPRRGRYLEFMSWKEAEKALRETKVVVVPLGARLKEHGLHLPLNNDWVMAEYLARRVLDECPVVATPTVEHGYYPAFVQYPGSVHIRLETFRDYIVDVCRSLARHGPKRFYVLNTGVSTRHALGPARELLAEEGIAMEYTDLLKAQAEVAKKLIKQEAGTHADEMETSKMLYMAPEIVRMVRAQKDIHPQKGEGFELTPDPNAPSGVYSPTGAWGDPTLATREKGRILTEALVAHLVAAVQKMLAAG